MASSTIPSPYGHIATGLYAPSTATDVHTDTTITLTQDWNLFKTLLFYFYRTSSSSSERSMLAIPQDCIAAGAWYALAQGSTIGSVRIGADANGNANKIRIQDTSLSGLYLIRVWGLN